MKRSAMPARRAPLRSRTPLPRTSRLRARPSGRARPRDPLAVWCEARIPDVCAGRAAHRHHVLPRSQGGTDAPGDTLDLCHACHAWVHAHPAASYERGWLRRRTAS